MTSHTIESFLADHRDLSDASIPQYRRNIPCCCDGNCAHAQFNRSTLDDLEAELRTAAHLGKALLARHEAYVNDSERERQDMMAHIQKLEDDKKTLERMNASKVQENRALLDQLEGLNTAVASSDQQVADLRTTLQTTQLELQRLSTLAARTEKLEQQIVDFESEQATWHTTMEEKDQSAKAANRRWQDSQRALNSMQEEMEQLDRDAKAEREKHAELLSRMERRHTVERELNSAAGRLKGAAAVKATGTATAPNVVSHFVKDILQDNANLQMGIVELRDMLQNSNEEVETLRKQLMNFGPSDATENAQPIPTRPHLSEEMRRATAQELHVHHHYHAPQPSAAPKNVTLRRPKKKRYGSLTAGHLSGASTPRSSISYSTPSAAAAILQETAASLPDISDHTQRWAMQAQRPAHLPYNSSRSGSPDSTTRPSSVFDRVFSDNGYDSSRPGTPETEDLGSPRFAPTHSKRPSASSFGSYGFPTTHKHRQSLDSILDVSIDNLRQTDQNTANAIIEEEEPEWSEDPSPQMDEDLHNCSHLSDPTPDFNLRPLRRAASHESLLSVSGMDIHTLKSRPSQLLTGYSSRSVTTSAALTDTTTFAALPVVITSSSTSSQSILSGMASDLRHVSAPKPGLGRKVGGWMFGRWGSTPLPTTASISEEDSQAEAGALQPAPSIAKNIPPKPTRATSLGSSSDGRSIDDMLVGTPQRRIKHRPPGINQMGPIPGFGPEVRNLHAPIMRSLDEEALRKVLGSAAETS